MSGERLDVVCERIQAFFCSPRFLGPVILCGAVLVIMVVIVQAVRS